MPDRFTTAPEAVRRYFDDKGQRPSFDWRDIASQEHAHTFTVAKSAGFDVLDDLRAAVKDAIANQTRWEDFAAELRPTLMRKGWWGQKAVIDPKTGEKVKAQLGSLKRLRTIHWANVATARAAGEWERTLSTKTFLPFLRYTLSSAERKRPEHRAWVGTILPVDDPWWQSHYPPNGWGCRCGVRQITRAQAMEQGFDPDDDPPEIITRPWLNKRTGQTVDVPIGIDPGWQTNPGINRGRNLMQIYSDKLEAMPAVAARQALAAFWSGNQARAWMNYPDRVHLPVARSERAGELMDARGPMVAISNTTASAKLAKHRVLDDELLANVDELLESGEWHEGTRPGSIDIFAEYRFNLWNLVLTRSADGYLYFRTIFPTSRKRRRGKRLD